MFWQVSELLVVGSIPARGSTFPLFYATPTSYSDFLREDIVLFQKVLAKILEWQKASLVLAEYRGMESQQHQMLKCKREKGRGARSLEGVQSLQRCIPSLGGEYSTKSSPILIFVGPRINTNFCTYIPNHRMAGNKWMVRGPGFEPGNVYTTGS